MSAFDIAILGASNGTTTALDYTIWARDNGHTVPAALGFMTGGGYTEAHFRYERAEGVTEELGFENKRFNLFTYTPVPDFAGTDTFTYSVSDGRATLVTICECGQSPASVSLHESF